MEHRREELRIDAKWTAGQRTPVWDAFWHRILSDITHDGPVAQPGDEACPQHAEGRS